MHASWAILCGLLLWFMGTEVVPAAYAQSGWATHWLMAMLFCLLMLGSVFLHEGAHMALSRLLDVRVRSVVLFPFGGIRDAEPQKLAGRAELLQAGAGPLFSLGLGAILTGGGYAMEQPLATWLGVFNLALGAWNLIPAEPLDGIGLLHVVARRHGVKATKVTRFGFHAADTLGVALVWLGLPVTILASFTAGMLLILYGSLLQVANNVYQVKQDPRRWRVLHRTEVGEVVANASRGLAGATTGYRGRISKVPRTGTIRGPAQLGGISGLKRGLHSGSDGEHLPTAPRPPLTRWIIPADARVVEALDMLDRPDAPEKLLVVEEHRIVGVCGRNDLLDHLRPEWQLVRNAP